jgi:hypothetical protein
LTPLPPPTTTPEQMKRIQETRESVKKFLKIMDAAHKASAKSTLRFAATKVQSSSTDDAYNKVEVLGKIDLQKLLPWQRRVYDSVNDYFKRLQTDRKRSTTNFIIARHGQGKSPSLIAQKQR